MYWENKRDKAEDDSCYLLLYQNIYDKNKGSSGGAHMAKSKRIKITHKEVKLLLQEYANLEKQPVHSFDEMADRCFYQIVTKKAHKDTQAIQRVIMPNKKINV